MSYEKRLETVARLDAWLSDQNYITGLRLFRECIGETVLYKAMLRGQNSFNARKLTETLTAERDRLKATAQEQVSNEPSSVAELRRQASGLMNERAALKAQIRVLNDEEQRRIRAFRVLDIGDELDRIYGQIEFYENNGMLWEPPAETESDEMILRRYLNLRTYISRTAKAAEVAILPEKRKRLTEKLKALQEEKAQLELTETIKKHHGHVV
ncbi:hypothetical protein GVN20_05640 [Runella sp. CRIBMP]|uniref:hypothetical protein n=1 Tax=Runella sp. CRIBMP TaxID=2683261 RepID=UPI0014136B84|nr:hypothetical protein [Runella sp. CRIBMP]NBB18832.1 hypothetical protein [Runella sp. CRIBMP]